MPQQDTAPIKEKIIFILKTRGPSIPVSLAREIGLSILFTSAFLSELLSEKKIKMSTMRIGSSPIYLIPGQEFKLVNFSHHLKSKEKEAYDLLKQKSFLKDRELEPAIRVALRSIKDFAIPFRYQEDIFWKYLLIPQSEFRPFKPLPKIEKPIQEIIPPEQKLVQKVVEQKQVEIFDEKPFQKIIQPEQEKKQIQIFDKKIPPKPVKKTKEKSEFVMKILDFLNSNNFPIVEEIDFKKREYNAIIEVVSDLGPVKFFLQAKDKKNISTDDLRGVLKKANARDFYCFFIITGELNKKAKEYVLEKRSLIKIKKL